MAMERCTLQDSCINIGIETLEKNAFLASRFLRASSPHHSVTPFLPSSSLPEGKRILFLYSSMDLTTPPPSPGWRSRVKISSQPRSLKWYFDQKLEHRETETPTGGLQNCDLPPPVKVFSVKGYDDKRGIGDISPSIPVPKQAAPTTAPIKDDETDDELGSKHGSSENSSLLRALQLAQTRAREAEKAALLANKQNKELAVLILEESSRLYAHRQWVKLLEIEVSMLEKRRPMPVKEEAMDEDDAEPADSGFLALALCLGIAGIGLVLSRCMF